MSSKANRERALAELLLELYDHDELLTVTNYADEDLYNQLAGRNLGLQELATEIARKAGKRGLVDDDFFAFLRRQRPKQRHRIDEVAALWQQSAPRPPSSSSGSTPALQRMPSSLRLILDRNVQWKSLTHLCISEPNRHLAFLVHGDSGQDVHLFLDRIERFWQEECASLLHRTKRVPLRFDGTKALTAADWDLHLRHAADYRALPLQQALERATANDPVLFLFCESPLAMEELGGDALAALETFLGEDLPQCLSQAKLAHPIRLLLAVEHGEPTTSARRVKDPLVQTLDEVLDRAAGIDFEPLESLHFPRWDEIELDFRRHLGRDLFKKVEDACEQAYDDVANDPNRRSFARLAKALDDLVHAHLQNR